MCVAMINYKRTQKTITLIALSFVFMCMGMLTALNDLLIPSMKAIFNLNYKQSLTIQLVWFSSFIIVSYPFGLLVRKTSYKTGIILGLLLLTIGGWLFLVAWWLSTYLAYLAALFIIASGVCFLQVISNPYTNALGEPATANQRLVIMHSFFALGTTVAPALGALALAAKNNNYVYSAATEITQNTTQLASVNITLLYIIVATISLMLAFLYWKLPLLDVLKAKATNNKFKVDHKNAWKHPHTVFGAIAAFLYVGAEILVASFIINFIEYSNLDIKQSTQPLFVSIYWGGLLVGRLLGPVFFKIWDTSSILLVCCIASCLLLILPFFIDGMIAVLAVVMVGSFNALMYPIIYSESMRSLSASAATQASAIVSTAIFGGSVIPMLGALAADYFSLKAAFGVGALCFFLISLYPVFLKNIRKEAYK